MPLRRYVAAGGGATDNHAAHDGAAHGQGETWPGDLTLDPVSSGRGVDEPLIYTSHMLLSWHAVYNQPVAAVAFDVGHVQHDCPGDYHGQRNDGDDPMTPAQVAPADQVAMIADCVADALDMDVKEAMHHVSTVLQLQVRAHHLACRPLEGEGRALSHTVPTVQCRHVHKGR